MSESVNTHLLCGEPVSVQIGVTYRFHGPLIPLAKLSLGIRYSNSLLALESKLLGHFLRRGYYAEGH